jgi:hypothetical protein
VIVCEAEDSGSGELTGVSVTVHDSEALSWIVTLDRSFASVVVHVPGEGDGAGELYVPASPATKFGLLMEQTTSVPVSPVPGHTNESGPTYCTVFDFAFCVGAEDSVSVIAHPSAVPSPSGNDCPANGSLLKSTKQFAEYDGLKSPE